MEGLKGEKQNLMINTMSRPGASEAAEEVER